MTIFDPSEVEYFRDKKRVALLNAFLEVNLSMMPHSIAVATGCSVDEALKLLLLLYSHYLVEGYLLLYHVEHLDLPFERRVLHKGLPPSEPITCSICEKSDIPDSDIYFDLEFSPLSPLKFGVSNDPYD